MGTRRGQVMVAVLITVSGCGPAGTETDAPMGDLPSVMDVSPPDLVTAHDASTATDAAAAADLAAADLAAADLAAPDLAAPDLAAPDLAVPDLNMADLNTPDL